jgi:hypothetical protein
MGISCGDIGVPLSRVFFYFFFSFYFPIRPTCFARRMDLRPKKNGFAFARTQVKG